MKFAPGTSQGGTPNFNESAGNYTDEAKSRLAQRDEKRTEFLNGFKSKFGGGMRKAGDYLTAFAQDPKNSSFLSGSKDLRNGIKNSQDSNEPSAVMKVMGATSNKTTSATSTSSKTLPSGAPTSVSPASSDDAYDFRGWAEDHMKNGKTSGQDVDYWEKKFRSNAAEAAKRRQAIDSYTGIKTQEEFNAADQANWNENSKNINAYTSQMHKNFGEFSGYRTNIQDNKQWEAHSAKWKKK